MKARETIKKIGRKIDIIKAALEKKKLPKTTTGKMDRKNNN